jgi:hypothetical protein
LADEKLRRLPAEHLPPKGSLTLAFEVHPARSGPRENRRSQALIRAIAHSNHGHSHAHR